MRALSEAELRDLRGMLARRPGRLKAAARVAAALEAGGQRGASTARRVFLTGDGEPRSR